MKWTGLLTWACIVHNVEACFDDGEFYCARLWYFWFVVFFIFVFILIGVIVTTNLCTRKNRRVGARGSNGRKSRRKAAKKKRESKGSIISKAPSDSSTVEPGSSKVPAKFSSPSKSSDGDIVASKRFFPHKTSSNKGPTMSRDHNLSAAEKGKASLPPEIAEETNPRDTILTARDLPTSLVIEEEEEPVREGRKIGVSNNTTHDTPC